MAFIRLETGVWYEEISVVALENPPAPLLLASIVPVLMANIPTLTANFKDRHFAKLQARPMHFTVCFLNCDIIEWIKFEIQFHVKAESQTS